MTRSRRRTLSRAGDLAGMLAAMAIGSLPYVLGLGLILSADLRPAKGQAREWPTDAPSYEGTPAHAPIPAGMHSRNEGGSDGAGLCVISSLRINGRYQGVPELEAMWRLAKSRPGGYSPGKLQGLLDEVMPGEKWASYVGTDPEVLGRLSAMGYPVGATMNTGALYGYRPIHHMVSLVHYDRNKDLACVVDNNQPGVYSWMSAGEYRLRWIDGGTGWAFIWLRRAAATARTHAAIVLAVGVMAALLIRRFRPAPAAEEPPDECE